MAENYQNFQHLQRSSPEQQQRLEDLLPMDSDEVQQLLKSLQDPNEHSQILAQKLEEKMQELIDLTRPMSLQQHVLDQRFSCHLQTLLEQTQQLIQQLQYMQEYLHGLPEQPQCEQPIILPRTPQRLSLPEQSTQEPPLRSVIQILKQPPHRIRFRYGDEKRKTGGMEFEIRVNYDDINKAVVVISCVTNCSRYRVHPNKLYGSNTKDGLCISTHNGDASVVIRYEKIGILRAKRNKQCIQKELLERAGVRVAELQDYGAELPIDPYKGGFEHASDINTRVVRLAVQVFVLNRENSWVELPPVVSDPIFDHNTPSDSYDIQKLSRLSGSFVGGDSIIATLYEKVESLDMEVVFYKKNNADGDESDVREATATTVNVIYNMIVFNTPPWSEAASGTCKVQVAARRRLDGGRYSQGHPVSFDYLPTAQHSEEQAESQLLQPGNKRPHEVSPQPQNRLRPKPCASSRALTESVSTEKSDDSERDGWNTSSDESDLSENLETDVTGHAGQVGTNSGEVQSGNFDEDSLGESSKNTSSDSDEDTSTDSGENTSVVSGEDISDNSEEDVSGNCKDDVSDKSDKNKSGDSKQVQGDVQGKAEEDILRKSVKDMSGKSDNYESDKSDKDVPSKSDKDGSSNLEEDISDSSKNDISDYSSGSICKSLARMKIKPNDF